MGIIHKPRVAPTIAHDGPTVYPVIQLLVNLLYANSALDIPSAPPYFCSSTENRVLRAMTEIIGSALKNQMEYWSNGVLERWLRKKEKRFEISKLLKDQVFQGNEKIEFFPLLHHSSTPLLRKTLNASKLNPLWG